MSLTLEKPPFSITRQFIDSVAVAKAGALVYVTEFGKATPIAYTAGGIGASANFIRKTPVLLASDGSMTITVYDAEGVRLTVFDKDNKTILYREDYNPRAIVQTVDFLQGVPD